LHKNTLVILPGAAKTPIFLIMKISGFSFARNADKLYFPIKEAITSILPMCSEFIVAVGDGDADDRTRSIIESIGDPRIRIIDTVWPKPGEAAEHIYSQQTNLALSQCSGDWCFYIQSDEAVHEKYLPVIQARCEELSADREVQGLLFNFRHFWGDYNHFQGGHKWYPQEIRIVRNGLGITSWKDAQSFRLHGEKIKVASVNAEVYHYGYVRPPRLMQRKSFTHYVNYSGDGSAREAFKDRPVDFDYGPLDKAEVFSGTHPKVMAGRIGSMDWKGQLRLRGKRLTAFAHDRLKYRFLSFIEKHLLGGRQLGGFKNYKLLKRG
jgi:glycosyltransferase involved in cell wall biosynthesis